MVWIYISTDAKEAAELIGKDVHNCNFEDLPIELSTKMVERIGFNPMSTINLQNGSEERVSEFVARFVRLGLYAAVGAQTSSLKSYFPNDFREREEMVKLSLGSHKQERGKNWITPFACLLYYSNNPNQIRTLS